MGMVAAFFFLFALPHATTKVDPATLAARDSHQGILVACDPYQNPKRVKEVMGKENPLKAGILPVEVYVRNSNRWPVAIKLSAIRLELAPPGGGRQQIEPLSADVVATRIVHPQPSNPASRRLPIPFPKLGHNSKWQKVRDKLQSVGFPEGAIGPGATVHGFLFFNLSGDFSILPYARLYVPEIKFVGNTQAIMFFEVRFQPSAPANGH